MRRVGGPDTNFFSEKIKVPPTPKPLPATLRVGGGEIESRSRGAFFVRVRGLLTKQKDRAGGQREWRVANRRELIPYSPFRHSLLVSLGTTTTTTKKEKGRRNAGKTLLRNLRTTQTSLRSLRKLSAARRAPCKARSPVGVPPRL
jgi:hypothetical protein